MGKNDALGLLALIGLAGAMYFLFKKKPVPSNGGTVISVVPVTPPTPITPPTETDITKGTRYLYRNEDRGTTEAGQTVFAGTGAGSAGMIWSLGKPKALPI